MAGVKRDNLDILFSHWIRARAGYRCECCGRNDIQMDCSHIVGRRNRQTRWDEANAICLCRNCHQFFTDHPIDHADWLRGYLGSDHLEAVRQRALSTDKVTQGERDEIADALYAKVEALGEKPASTGRKRAKKAAKKRPAKRAKVNSSQYKRKVDGTTVRRDTKNHGP